MTDVKFRTHFTEAREKKGIVFKNPSLTKQAFKDECNINKIMARYNITGQLDHVRAMQPIYGDATAFSDYRDALEKVQRADAAFMALPAELRTELANNPANMLSYMQNPANYDKCVKYGIFEPKSAEQHNVVEGNPIKSDEVSAQ